DPAERLVGAVVDGSQEDPVLFCDGVEGDAFPSPQVDLDQVLFDLGSIGEGGGGLVGTGQGRGDDCVEALALDPTAESRHLLAPGGAEAGVAAALPRRGGVGFGFGVAD